MNFTPNDELSLKLELLKKELHELMKVIMSQVLKTSADQAAFINSFLFVPEFEEEEVDVDGLIEIANEFSENFRVNNIWLNFCFLRLDDNLKPVYSFRLSFDNDTFEYSFDYTIDSISELTFENGEDPTGFAELINHIDSHILKLKEAQVFGMLKNLKV
jgi:hypothetical protein